MTRQSARLGDGFETFFERRSSKFRSNILKAQEEADKCDVIYEYGGGQNQSPDELFDRIVSVEKRSWKGKKRAGISTGRMRDFYRLMIDRLHRRDALRIGFARLDDEDIAYCFGGLFEKTYRGLQMSYDDDYSDLSPGNILQIEMIQNLIDEGIETYDMGQAMEYKSRWTNDEFTTDALVIRK
jgi:CelD/BcsL family acetyltransferase involved in cellulose biosynthesis